MFFLTMLIFVGLAVLVAAVGMKLYVRPKEAMERVAKLEWSRTQPALRREEWRRSPSRASSGLLDADGKRGGAP